MIDRAEKIRALTPGKRELLARRLLKKHANTSQGRVIPARKEGESLSLSFSQERLWFLDQLLPGNTIYVMAGLARVRGPLDEDAAIGSLNEIIRRHEVLRTTFKAVDGRPAPVVAPELVLGPQTIDLRTLPADEREAEARRIIEQETRRPFDLARGPLIRFTLLRLADEGYIGLLTMHHIVADGVSTKVLFQEFGAIYQAYVTGRPSPLPELPIQYADYALWQREWLQGETLESQLAYWKQQFGDDIPVIDLPTDRPRPATPTHRGSRHTFSISPELTAALKNLSRREGVTLFMTLLAAYGTLLYRYTGQDDLVIGIPVAGRNQPELAGLIGCFLNMLALRIHLSANPAFRELLGRIQQTALGAYAHQDLPFEKLVDELQPERTMSHAPLAQVAFSFEDNPTDALHIQGLTVQFEELDSGTAKMDLALELTEVRRGDQSVELSGWFDYNSDIFDPATVERISIHFQTLLEGIVAHPDGQLSTLPLLTEAELRRLLIEWNATAADYPHDVCIHRAFEAQVERTPDAVALICEDQRLSYRELNCRANQLAHYLQSLGVGPETMVGLCLERSLEMVVGVFGILKAGGAYVPLDPAHPEDRLTFMLSDSQGVVLLTQERLVERLPEVSARVVCLDKDWSTIARENEANPVSAVGADNLAYVLYTSGSTGKPKGVTVPHRDLVHHTLAFIDVQELTPSDRMLLFVSLIFDAAAAALYPPLLCGASVVLPPMASSELSGGEFTQICEQQAVSVIHLPAAFWHQWVDSLEASGAPFAIPLRVMMTGGETPNLEKLRTWSRLVQRPVKFFNAYGPTEAVITITLYQIDCDEAALQQMTRIPAGRPIANKQLYLLDPHLNPVPVGVPGEVYVGGIGLARGYLNDPQLTEEKFIRDPFNATPGARLYRTGDMARYLPDGNIEFISRIDQQVKIRGIRIELGEIEAALAHHPDVLESVALAREDLSGNKRLVVYIVARPDTTPTASALRHFLEEQLPEYMLPSAFVFLEAIPLTTLGKVNRRALPAPDWSRSAVASSFVAPRTPIERELAYLWSQVIGVEQVGIYDNFFQLGGHSLLATQIIAQIGKTFQVDLPMRSLFETPTVAGLAVTIGQQKAGQGDRQEYTASLPTITPAPEQRYLPFPLNDVQQAYWIGRSDMIELGNVSCHGYVEVDCVNLNLPRLNQAWQRLIERHDMLRAFVRLDGQQQILPDVPFYEIEVLDLRDSDQQTIVDCLAATRQTMSHQVLACDRWPLFEIRAARLPEGRFRLFASVDLLIADAWSFSILLQELEQFAQNPAATLPPLELSFRDYVLAEQALQSSELYQRSLAYWQNRLTTLPPGPELPLAKNPGLIEQPRFARRSGRLEPEDWHGLKQRAARAGLTPSGVLLAAYAEVLTAWSKNPRMTINLTLFNRLPIHPQVNEIFGDFTSITLLEVDNSTPDRFAVRARRLQEQLWADLDHRYVSGVQVQRELMRRKGGAATAMMPVVCTSTLTLDGKDARTSLAWLGDMVYAIGQTPQVWLDHVVAEEAGALVFHWDAVEELFPAGLIDDMFDAYCRLLRRLIADESAWHEAGLSLTPPAQLAQRAAVNATAAPIPAGLLHAPFAAQVARRPQQPAIISPRRTLSYEELYRCANQVGRRLRELGAQPNTLVAIVMEKGWEQVVAALGILQAGAAYLPVDATLPKERLHYVLEHGQATLALTQSWLDDTLDWPAGIQHFVVDGPELAGISDQPLDAVQRQEDLAYVIYTSGSTGLPKGVMIDHRGALNTIVDLNERFAIGPNDRVLALSSLSFDLSVYDIFGLLAAGGTVVIPDAAARREPAHWAELVAREGVTIWNTVPALMGMLVEYVGGRGDTLPESLRLVMMSGDWIPLALPNQIKALASGAQLYSLGGSTEPSIWSILYPIETVAPDWQSIPYGKPMVNQTFHVLDHSFEPRPVWVPGQLYIGGIGLALGYWRDEAKTQASFITHPRTGERLYRTGDLGRYLPDGTIEFLGREDFQVKIQGYRIELGEIESVLALHPGIQAAVVVAMGERHANKRLAGYIVCKPGQHLDVDELRQFLKDRLPEYMVPSAFVFLDQLPLTDNGKVNRRALPPPDLIGAETERSYVAPRTPIEIELADICARVLGITQVGIHDNFFELGGNSVQATQLVSLLRETFAIELPLRSIFEAQSVAGLAEKIEAIRWSQQPAEVLLPMAAEEREEGEL